MINFQIEWRPGQNIPGLLLLIVAVIFVACSEKEKPQEMKAEEGAGQISTVDLVEKLIPKLSEQQQAIQHDPQNVDHHKNLVITSIDEHAGVARAVGYGKPPENAKSSAIAIQAAERAAYLDGCRWLAYILQWEKNPQQPDFGSIKGEIPGARIVHKMNSADQTVTVLVESKLPHRK